MAEPPRPARDLQLLDAVDAFRREPLDAEVWRVVRDSRDPVLGSPSLSRWCDGTFDVLAIAEIADYLTTPREAGTKVVHGPSILPEGEKGTR